MKRLLSLLITILLIIFLSACTNNLVTPMEANENNMIINIKNNANFDFYGLEVKILDHSPSIVNADGSQIEKGEELRVDLLREDVELDGEVEMEVLILTNNNDGERIPINKKMTLELESYKEMFFEITGEMIREADIKRVK